MQLVRDLKKNILVTRDQRMAKEKQLLNDYDTTLIVFSLNLPGGTVITDTIAELHSYGMRQLVASIAPYEKRVEHIEVSEDPLGPISYICLDVSWEKVKSIAIDIEERDMYGRLFDIDVIQSTGQHIGRKDLNHAPRRCFICDEEATICRRSGAHTLDELQTYVRQLLHHFEDIMNLRYQRVN